jgi:hypothetical protein
MQPGPAAAAKYAFTQVRGHKFDSRDRTRTYNLPGLDQPVAPGLGEQLAKALAGDCAAAVLEGR